VGIFAFVVDFMVTLLFIQNFHCAFGDLSYHPTPNAFQHKRVGLHGKIKAKWRSFFSIL